jgi:hypothetical protein
MSARTRAPGVATCFAVIALMDVAPRLVGFRRALRLARWLASGNAADCDADAAAVTAHRIAVAGAFYPRRALCLEQSLALYVLLRRRGIAADLRLGVQARPFYAHAWVEVDGSPINERSELAVRLATFPVMDA